MLAPVFTAPKQSPRSEICNFGRMTPSAHAQRQIGFGDQDKHKENKTIKLVLDEFGREIKGTT